MVLDNQAKRSFAQADVNTVIALFSSPDDHRDWTLNKTARFVMFKVPFEHILSPIIFDEIEATRERKVTPEYRTSPAIQKTLLEDGWEWPEEADEEAKKRFGFTLKGSKYGGNKWGGKYLRAPDIYWTILEKGKGKLVRLGDIAEVRFGIKTGANEFFYLDDAKIQEWGIEDEFLKPVIKSPRECKRILIDPRDLKFKIFMCHKDKRDLKGAVALEYIKWGESQRFHERPSCSGRARWWEITGSHDGKLAWAMIHAARHSVHVNNGNIQLDHNFFEIIAPNSIAQEILCAYAISIFGVLMKELVGRQYGGGSGPCKTDGVDIAQMLFVKPDSVLPWTNDYKQAYNSCLKRDPYSFDIERSSMSFLPVDNVWFEYFQLTQSESEAVYEATINLVEARLKKAESLNPNKSRRRSELAEDVDE